jgi:ketosteroid isomerase-like protein
VTLVERADVDAWVERYVAAWRTPGTDPLAALFTEDATYAPSPWADPLVGLPAIRAFWESERDGPDEGFDLVSEVVAVDGSTGVVRVGVDYATGSRWRDLWLVQLDGHGLCFVFEEWPFAPEQRDGHD